MGTNMGHDYGARVNMIEFAPEEASPAAVQHIAPGDAAESPGRRGPAPRRLRWLAGGLIVAAGAVALVLAVRAGSGRQALASSGTSADAIENSPAGLPVNTILPARKTLVRSLEQPGSIKPQAQAEVYAKTSGYVKYIQRDLAPSEVAKLLAGDFFASLGTESPVAAAQWLALGLTRLFSGSPQKDIGSVVRAGEVLIRLDVPELDQDVAQKEALLLQAEAELKQARTGIGTFEAGVNVAESSQKQAEADVRRYVSEHAFQGMQLKRLEDLLRDRIGTPEGVAEQRNKVNAAQAALESARAKAQTAKAEAVVVSSKLAAARDDVLVKEARVRVAREELRRARILADYANIRAPFDGVITFRAVDEGDFVQNSSSGQARHVMTIAAIDRVKVVVQVPEREAPWVRVGAEASVRMDARGSWKAQGYVARTSRALDGQSRTMQAEIDVDNRDGQLLPGMYGQVVVTLQRIENALPVPASAVFSRRGENFVLVVRDGVARRQRVRIRYDDGRAVEVVKLIGDEEVPLDGTEELIVSNKGEIADGQRVHATRLGGGADPSTRGHAAP